MQPELIAEINVDQLAANLAALRRECGDGPQICAALKANAYGHGLEIVAPVLLAEGVELAAVSRLIEAMQLRRLGWLRPILCLGQPFAIARETERAHRLDATVDHDVCPTLTRIEDARDLSHCALAAGRVIDVHVNVDTGIGRMGVPPGDLLALCRAIHELPGLALKGIYTHFASADAPDSPLTGRQQEKFKYLLGELAGEGVGRPQWVHAANSAATVRGIGREFDLIRVGLGMYGYRPSDQIELPSGAGPIMRLTSHLILVKDLPAGHAVGYGATFVTPRPTCVGIVPIGYADGYLRSLSNRAGMEVNGHWAPVIGNISMDLTILDVTDVPGVRTGDPVVVLDHRPDCRNSVESIARLLGTIPYEITCLLGDRIHRVAVQAFDAEPGVKAATSTYTRT